MPSTNSGRTLRDAPQASFHDARHVASALDTDASDVELGCDGLVRAFDPVGNRLTAHVLARPTGVLGWPLPVDFDDADPDVHPGVHPEASEVCNGIDDNCNGAIEELGC